MPRIRLRPLVDCKAMIPFKSVRIGPFDVSITMLAGEDRDKCFGMFSETQMSIMMRDTFANEQQEAETFLHELLHAIYCVFGVKPKDPEERLISPEAGTNGSWAFVTAKSQRISFGPSPLP